MTGDKARWLFVAAFYLIALEAVSRWPAAAPCLIGLEQHPEASQDNHQQGCPTFFRGSLILLSRADHFIESHDKSIIAVFTVVLAISTIGLWLATNKLWQAGERQMELIASNAAEQARDMKLSIAAAQRSADAAMQAIGSDRAWMTIDGFNINEATDSVIDGIPCSSALVLSANWRNRGRSPAINASLWVSYQIVGFKEQTAPYFEREEPPLIDVAMPIGPNATGGTMQKYLIGSEYDAIFNRTAAVAMYSVVTYRDVFVPAVERKSEVCVRIRFAGRIVDQNTGHEGNHWDIMAFGPQNIGT
jgi:hypothetical protein